MKDSGRQSSDQNILAIRHSSRCVMLQDSRLGLQWSEGNEDCRCITFTKICMAKGL